MARGKKNPARKKGWQGRSCTSECPYCYAAYSQLLCFPLEFAKHLSRRQRSLWSKTRTLAHNRNNSPLPLLVQNDFEICSRVFLTKKPNLLDDLATRQNYWFSQAKRTYHSITSPDIPIWVVYSLQKRQMRNAKAITKEYEGSQISLLVWPWYIRLWRGKWCQKMSETN